MEKAHGAALLAYLEFLAFRDQLHMVYHPAVNSRMSRVAAVRVCDLFPPVIARQQAFGQRTILPPA